VARATWKGALLAQSEECVEVEGNLYFPPQSVDRNHLRASDTHTVCSWKGTASYYDVVVEDEVNRDAAWYYPELKHIRGYVAFWRGVEVVP
jgi:uncharacterized protein (DUF427 family)